MDGAGLMARGGHCLPNETHPDGERCCLNLGHHHNIAAAARESAEGGVFFGKGEEWCTLMFFLS